VLALVITGVGGRMVSERVRDAVPAPFEAEMVSVAFPTVVGTPLMSPLVASKVRPLGRFKAP
jgi:hypothetical protein